MSDCPTCGNRDYLCQQCKMDALERRHGLPSDYQTDDEGVSCWVQDIDETWHASMRFEGTRHTCACGHVLETPVAGVREDPRFVDEATTCEACVAYLEREVEDARLPDGGGFERASRLRADGGVDLSTASIHRLPPSQGGSGWREGRNCVPHERKFHAWVPIGTRPGTSQDCDAQAVPNSCLSWYQSTCECQYLPLDIEPQDPLQEQSTDTDHDRGDQ